MTKNKNNRLENPRPENVPTPEELKKIKKAKGTGPYPAPKKGSKVTCLACKDGKVMVARGVIRNCGPCSGKGYIIAK